MRQRNERLLEELLEAVAAKDLLDDVRDLVDCTEGDAVDKAELLALLEREEEAPWE